MVNKVVYVIVPVCEVEMLDHVRVVNFFLLVIISVICQFVENGLDVEKFLRTISEILPWLEG